MTTQFLCDVIVLYVVLPQANLEMAKRKPPPKPESIPSSSSSTAATTATTATTAKASNAVNDNHCQQPPTPSVSSISPVFENLSKPRSKRKKATSQPAKTNQKQKAKDWET